MRIFGHGLFSYEKGTRTFSTEISTLEANTSRGSVFSRVFPDACDVGFAILGKGKVVRFCLDNEIKDDEGDVLYWRLQALTSDLPKGSAPVKCVIFND